MRKEILLCFVFDDSVRHINNFRFGLAHAWPGETSIHPLMISSIWSGLKPQLLNSFAIRASILDLAWFRLGSFWAWLTSSTKSDPRADASLTTLLGGRRARRTAISRYCFAETQVCPVRIPLRSFYKMNERYLFSSSRSSTRQHSLLSPCRAPQRTVARHSSLSPLYP